MSAAIEVFLIVRLYIFLERGLQDAAIDLRLRDAAEVAHCCSYSTSQDRLVLVG